MEAISPSVAPKITAPLPHYAVVNDADLYYVIRRNGHKVIFDAAKITLAMSKAFLAAEGGQSAASARVRESVARLTEQVVTGLTRRLPGFCI